jgi:hypothetical protein
MRTTLDIDEDILQAAKELAARRRTNAGKIISELARKALQPDPPEAEIRNGVPLLASRPDERPVTMELVNRLRDDEPAASP